MDEIIEQVESLIARANIGVIVTMNGTDHHLINQLNRIKEALTKQKWQQHGVSGKRPDCPYCMEPISERMIEEWTNWLRNAKAACANGAVDKTVRGGLWCECGIPNRNTTSSQCGTCFKPIAGISAGRF